MPRIARGGVGGRAGGVGLQLSHLLSPTPGCCSSLFSDMARKLGPALVTFEDFGDGKN